ncbi:MAG TPA: hypothetical protein VNO22_14360 [Planctomycetota bacterium]|nr:hypothetical protein [Planctomycetota bacterium]
MNVRLGCRRSALRRIARCAFAVLIAAAGGCSAIPIDPHSFPLERLSEAHRAKVEAVLSDVAAVVSLEGGRVKSRPEIYDFLLDEMPFTGGVVRALGRGDWKIFRDPERPERNVFHVLDADGMSLRFELVWREPSRRLYVSEGVFPMGILPALRGSTVVVMRTIPQGEEVWTDAVVYVRVETPFYSGLAKGLRGLVEDKVREKSGYFIRAARWVAEEAAARPDELCRAAAGSPEVDPAALEEFRKRFAGP